MKATARKIKDNEWIAEVTDYTFEYPIIGDTANFKEGQEIDGTIKDFYDRDERTVFELQSYRENLEKRWAEYNAKTTPPIHSDPAGEPFMIEVRYADLQKLHARIKELEQPQTSKEVNWEKEYHDLLHELKNKSPQTSRTYTEGEIQAIKNESYNSGYNKGYQARGDKNRLFPQ